MLRLRALLALGACLVAVSASAQTRYYRSIGSAPDYSTGTVTAVNGETFVIGSPSVQWRTANRGRGDRIEIGGTPYTILSVDAENELTLTQPYAGSTTFGASYIIKRKFQTLNDWENCIEGSVACPGVLSPSLPADMRIEEGVVYKDSKYFMNTGGEQLRLDGAVTDSNHTITLTTTPPNRHHGVANTGVVLDNGSQDASAIDIRTGFVTIEWIELHHGGSNEQIFVSGVGSSSKVVVRNVLFRDDDQTSHGFHVNDDAANIIFFNNVLYGLNDGVRVDGLQVDSTGLFEFYHNTFFENVIGLHSTTSTSTENDVIVMNGNLAHSNLVADFDAQGPNSSLSGNNWSGDPTGGTHFGVGGIMLADIRFVSDTAPVDLHITRGSIVEDNGSAIAAVTDDLDGRPRGIPDIGADEADTSSANRVKILTAKSGDNHVQLEWQHPDFGPMDFIRVVRNSTAFPSDASDGVVACTFTTPSPGTKGQCADSQSPLNGTEYFYAAFTFDLGGNYSKVATVSAKPLDPALTPPDWTYESDATALEPAGVRGANAFLVSNDNFFHAMQGGSGATAGEWPLGWIPYRLPTVVQHRPVIVDISGVPTALLGGQDGRVYAVSTETGRLVWKSPILGTSINAAPAALVSAYGASGGGADHVFVGTSDLNSNALHVLDLQTGASVARFDDIGQPSNIGAITGIAVKYPSGPVFFTSDTGSGVAPRNVWSIDVSVLPSVPLELWSDGTPGPVDSGPTRYKGMILVGSRAGVLYGYPEIGPTALWSTAPFGDGAVKSPIFPVWPNDTVILTTDTTVHSVQIAGTGGCATAPCVAWSQSMGTGVSPPLVVPGTDQLFVGLDNGELHEILLDLAAPMNPPVGTRMFPISTSWLGGPAFSLGQLALYVSDSSGKVHGIPWPIP